MTFDIDAWNVLIVVTEVSVIAYCVLGCFYFVKGLGWSNR